jgi:hypothetical protein
MTPAIATADVHPDATSLATNKDVMPWRSCRATVRRARPAPVAGSAEVDSTHAIDPFHHTRHNRVFRRIHVQPHNAPH